MSVRAGIVVTGTEVLSGIVADRNGPWLSERLRERGVELAHIVVVADRPADVRAALDFLAGEGLELIITTGGLGPTADDLTAEVVGGFAGRAMVLDEALEERILAILRRNRARWRTYSEAAMRAGNRKQALVPDGATILEPVGTAPGLVVPPADGAGPLVVVLPGPPGELRPMWAVALETEPLRALLARAGALEQRMLRLYGVPESEIALSLVEIERGGVPLDELEITTCLRRGEIEIATVFPPQASATYDAFAGAVRERHGDTLFSEDGATIDEQVATLLAGRTIAVAESCTGGRMAGRLTDRAGSSAYVLGGVVVYSDAAKVRVRRRPRRADRAPRRGVAGGRRRARRRGDRALRRPARGGDHRDRRTRRRQRGEAGRHGLRQRGRARRRAGGPRRAAARRPSDGARAHDDGGDAPAAPAAAAAVSLRLFVALDLPAPAVAALAAFRDLAADPAIWRPLPEANFHVTLAFLGHRPEGDADIVAAMLEGLDDRPPPALALGAGLLLPARRARVLTVAVVDASGALARLQATVSDALAAAGVYTPEARPFRPHVTVGRLRPGARAPRTLAAEPEPVGFGAGAVTLYRSRTGRGGAVYEPLASRRLR